MVNEIILGIIVLSLIGFIAWRERQFHQERKDLIAGVLSKDLKDFQIAIAPPEKKGEKEATIPSEWVSEETLDDEAWFKAIKKTNEAN